MRGAAFAASTKGIRELTTNLLDAFLVELEAPHCGRPLAALITLLLNLHLQLSDLLSELGGQSVVALMVAVKSSHPDFVPLRLFRWRHQSLLQLFVPDHLPCRLPDEIL